VIRTKTNLRTKKVQYNPNVGFIGQVEVKVANYIFSAKRNRSSYGHSKAVAKRILKKNVAQHYQESQRLTKFLKTRDLTFSKSMANGTYKIFTVPCTTTVVPMQKSLFNDIETAAQKLIVSLRKVLQNIYGAKDLKSSAFIKSLPKDVRNIFIKAIEDSAHYYRPLHHPNMKDYPFFDCVGLDLVLIEDYITKSKNFPEMITTNEKEIPNLPFRILELNAGSPSGASNNMNMLEGIYKEAPEILENLGKVMPNDHFKVLGETYKMLGEEWTGVKNGVQILLPPGGQNGAAPEIHQLAAYSGLIYADPVQLYQDENGYIRLRTITGNNPIVTAVYSRINSDSALFDPEKDIILRDADSGEAIYLRDTLKLGEDGKAPLITDSEGNAIPLHSDYAVPGLLEAILNKKIYLGGLNRILDNKIILATLTHYAPKYFENELNLLGLNKIGPKIAPPQTLPPTMESVETILKNPEEWVVKAPNLSGGTGVYILKTLNKAKRNEVLAMIKDDPTSYAYQQLVKIGRIPVAVHRTNDGYRFANLAADIRIWMFYGAGKNVLPKMTHNALVRYAPHEKGAMSSIVNTSKGGGYAPFVIIDDINSSESVYAKDLVKTPDLIPLQSDLPSFVAAQMVQISRMITEMNKILKSDSADTYRLLGLAIGLKMQCKEVLAFLNPRVIENIYKVIDILESKISKIEIAKYYNVINNNHIKIVALMQKYDGTTINKTFKDLVDSLRVLNLDKISDLYTREDQLSDKVILKEIRKWVISKDLTLAKNKDLKKITTLLNKCVSMPFPSNEIGARSSAIIANYLVRFCEGSRTRLLDSGHGADFAKLFTPNFNHKELKFETLYLGEGSIHRDTVVASQKEFATGKLLTETDYVSSDLKLARTAWLDIETRANTLNRTERFKYIQKQRKAHFRKFPFLNRYQELINKNVSTIDNIIEILEILPYAKYNLEQFAKQQGIGLREIFTTKMTPNRVALLSSTKIKFEKLSSQEHAGECFAKKRQKHGLFSDSDIFIWIRKELNPFTLAYTAGHELIHFQQIQDTMKLEKNALRTSAMEQANFLNYYGNFLGISTRSLENLSCDIQLNRRPLYGFSDRLVPYFSTSVITDLRNSLNSESNELWEKTLNKYGSLLAYMMPNSPAVKVKALQEIIPALENAKNILFAKELGLEVDYDEVLSALPIANKNQLKQYRSLILKAAKSSKIEWEALRIIGSHQYHGVNFAKTDKDNSNLTLRPLLTTISLGSSYNQTQQQQ
jgi:uncharacterized circularly permuted ATP-grasp superfamily protein